MSVEELVEVALDAQHARTRLDAGAAMAHGGWAVFPVPAGKKFDAGAGANSYMTATVDPGVFEERARAVMEKTGDTDVNVCLTPGRCETPLVVVDLDGAANVQKFWDEARGAGHEEDEIRSWLRVASPRADVGRHVYFTTPGGIKYGNAQHAWGGEVRCGRGHVVVPPSRVDAGGYAFAGGALVEAPEWVIAGLKASVVTNDNARLRTLELGAAGTLVMRLSQWDTDAYAAAALTNITGELLRAHSGSGVDGRNPTMNKGVNRLLDLALEGRANAREVLDVLCSTYVQALMFDEKRDPVAEFNRSITSWAQRKEDLEETLEAIEGRFAWVERKEHERLEAEAADYAVEAKLEELHRASGLDELHAVSVQLRLVAEGSGRGLVRGRAGVRALEIGQFVAGELGRAAVRRGLLDER